MSRRRRTSTRTSTAPELNTAAGDLEHADLNEEYLEGGCFYLAEALSRRLGWPIELIVEGPRGEEDVVHAYVIDPQSGRALDITGFSARPDLLLRYGIGDVPSRLHGARRIVYFLTPTRFRRRMLRMLESNGGVADETEYGDRVDRAEQIWDAHLLPRVKK